MVGKTLGHYEILEPLTPIGANAPSAAGKCTFVDSPFDGEDLVANVGDDVLAIGFLLILEQEVASCWGHGGRAAAETGNRRGQL